MKKRKHMSYGGASGRKRWRGLAARPDWAISLKN